MSEPSTLGARVRLMREARGLTLAEVHAVTGMSKTYLVRVEHDKANLTLTTLQKLADALLVSPAWLAFGRENDHA